MRLSRPALKMRLNSLWSWYCMTALKSHKVKNLFCKLPKLSNRSTSRCEFPEWYELIGPLATLLTREIAVMSPACQRVRNALELSLNRVKVDKLSKSKLLQVALTK